MKNRGRRPVVRGGKPALDVALRALSSQRSRYVCYYLLADDVGEINETYLAREVASWETGVAPSRVPTEKVDRVQRELRDETLPTLDCAGFIKYDPQSGNVEYGHPSGPCERLLQVCKQIEQPG